MHYSITEYHRSFLKCHRSTINHRQSHVRPVFSIPGLSRISHDNSTDHWTTKWKAGCCCCCWCRCRRLLCSERTRKTDGEVLDAGDADTHCRDITTSYTRQSRHDVMTSCYQRHVMARHRRERIRTLLLGCHSARIFSPKLKNANDINLGWGLGLGHAEKKLGWFQSGTCGGI